MKPRLLSDVARAVDGSLRGHDTEVQSVSVDSRVLPPGSLFVALAGDRTDGHRFVDDAFARGAVGVLVADGRDAGGPAVHVRSTADALIRLAADERQVMGAKVVGITGANGKTSTKDLAQAVVGARFRTHASPGSYNNEIGLPLTLLGAPVGTEVVVAEMGARRLGDVKLLAGIARPHIVAVTNVGVAHMEVFGSWASIVEASAEPVESLGADGVAILNADDPVVSSYAERCVGRVVTYGTAVRRKPRDGVHVLAEEVSLDSDGRAEFRLVSGGDRATVHLAVPGEHMVSNALAAAAVGIEVGVPFDEIPRGLSAAAVSRWRMETFENDDGVRVLNDAYNANPESTSAAIRTARWIAGEGRLIAVLGEMAELGPIAGEEHEHIGELAARVRVDRLITVGDAALAIARGALREGMDADDVASYGETAQAVEDVRRTARSGDLVLCKGSRVAGLERVAEALR